MKNNKLNRNFKRLLAVSLGACCASTIMVSAAEKNDINKNDEIQNGENQNDEIQNEVATNIQTMLLNITQQTRKTIWDTLNQKTDEKLAHNTGDGQSFNFSFVDRGVATDKMLPFLLLACQDNQNTVKLMMIKDNSKEDSNVIYILPYSEKDSTTQHAKHITQYMKNNPNIDIAKFERDCWENQADICRNNLNSSNGSNGENSSFIDRIQKTWGEMTIQQKLIVIPPAATLLTAIINKL